MTDTNGRSADTVDPGISLTGVVLPDARNGELVDLGVGPRLGLVTLVRHRY